nr:hypothetical protein Iba_scaffold36951CG0010 [Ipomoea batatas]GMD80071.1 hypothetical protein Iba_scaffold1565192CG0010 [Ipomoea batatas]
MNKSSKASTSGNRAFSCPCADFPASGGIRRFPFGTESFPEMVMCPSDEAVSSS